jgi:hypothetical protein
MTTGLRIDGIARTRAFRALWMAKELGSKTKADNETPAAVTRRIAWINQL